MQISHVPEILAIERDIFTSPWSKENFRQELMRIGVSRAFVALLGGRVVGYEIAWFLGDEVHLVNIAVARIYQQMKIGTLLLNYLIGYAMKEGKRIITLEVRRSNTIAQAFYRSFSFDCIGLRRAYYTDNREDALLMMLDMRGLAQRRERSEGTSGK